MTGAAHWLDVVNPANEQIIGQVPDCGQQELDAAVAAARGAFPAWSRTPIADRRAVLTGISNVIKDHKDELMRLLTSEQGKPHAQAAAEISAAATNVAALATLDLEDSPVRLSRTRRVPVGVVGAIVPWNFPVAMAVAKITPALLSGCTMVLKPSPFTPLATLRLAELIADLVPPGVLNVVTGGDALGPMLTAHAGINKISFTGSTATGKRVMESASKDLKRITLELGGNDASIVLPDADVAKVAEQLFWSSFANAGQLCLAEDTSAWVDVDTDEKGTRASVLRADIQAGRPHQTNAKLWIKYVYTGKYAHLGSSRVLKMVNCPAQTFYDVSYANYPANGEIFTGNRPFKVEQVIPESRMAVIVEALCSDKSANR